METKVRELHGKLLLGAFAAQAGFDVILGEQRELTAKMSFLPRGIVLEKGATPLQARRIAHMASLGHRVVAWCEEGLVYRNDEAYLRDRIHLPAMADLDRFFAWGKVQADTVLKKATDSASKMVLAGNPRFDLLRPELRELHLDDAERLRQRYGPYVLIATNFARANHFGGPELLQRTLHQRTAGADRSVIEYTEGWTAFIGEIFRAFVAMMPVLADAFPNVTFVVRPHPSENRDTWKQALAELPNVRVVHEGNVVPWILGAQALVHNSCTTGVEAYLLGRPPIAYRPACSTTYDSNLPNAISHQAFTTDELINVLGAIINETPIPGFDDQAERQRRAVAQSYISGMDGAFACERIIDSMRDIAVEPDRIRLAPWRRTRTFVVNALQSARVAAASAAGRYVVPESYMRHKFSTLGVDEGREILARFAAVTGMFKGVRIEPVRGVKNGFRIGS